jgi:hypothetical protein
MAEPQIVSCPGCGKRYSVPAGAAPGQFQCQDCSSVVVYGRGGGTGGRPAVPARTHAKAAAVKRKLARNRRDEEEDDEGDRPGHGRADPKKQDPTVYVMAIVAVVLVIGGVAFAVSRSKKEEKPKTSRAPETAAAPSGVSKFTAEDEPAPAPAPAPAQRPAPKPAPAPAGDPPKPEEGMKTVVRGGISDKADKFTPAANPPSGGNYGKSQAAILLLLKDKRAEVWVDPGHLPDTPPDLAQKIDADVAKMADPNGGAESARAQDRLIKIGRPAIPKVVGLTSRLDFSKYSNILEARDACILGAAIDNVLRSITGYDKVRMLQYDPQNGKITEYLDTLDGWCLWWFTIGYKRETFYKAAGAAEDEKL